MPPRITPRSSSVPAQTQCLRSQAGSSGRKPSQGRDFSQSSSQPFHASCRQETRLRRNMFAWLNGPGRAFREPLKNSTNYLGAYDRTGRLRRGTGQEPAADAESKTAKNKEKEEEDEELDEVEKEQRREAKEAAAEAADAKEKLPAESGEDLKPFPLNRNFRSQSVLSEPLREQLWKEVVENKQSVSTVSAVYGVDMRRVGAVVRLKTIEKEWIAKDKKLATPYASAVLSMIPQTNFNPKSGKIVPHESINDLPVHPYTRQQIFYPTSESRQFTRADAAKVFSPTLLPADERIPHPELIELERDNIKDISRPERIAKVQARDEKLRLEKEEKERKQREWQAKNLQTVDGQRWAFKFQNINVENAGKDGRGKSGVGWRYGNPHQDRRRGLVKIPTTVE